MKKFFLGMMWLNFTVLGLLDCFWLVQWVYPLGIDLNWFFELRQRLIMSTAHTLICERLLLPLVEE